MKNIFFPKILLVATLLSTTSLFSGCSEFATGGLNYPRICNYLTTVVFGTGVAGGTGVARLSRSFDLDLNDYFNQVLVGPDAGPTGYQYEAKLLSIEAIASSGLLDFSLLDSLSLTVIARSTLALDAGVTDGGMPVVSSEQIVASYVRSEGEATSSPLSISPSPDFNVADYVSAGPLRFTASVLGVLPAAPFLVELRACYSLNIQLI